MHPHFRDEFTSVRDARTRIGDVEPSGDDLARGLARVERALAERGAAPKTRARRVARGARARRVAWAGVGVVAAGALVGVVLVATPSPVWGPVAPADSHAQAVELLRRAAKDVTFEQAIPPGRVLQTTSFSESLMIPEPETVTDETGEIARNAPLPVSPLVFRTESTATEYESNDPQQQLHVIGGQKLVELFGDPDAPVTLFFSAGPQTAGSLVGTLADPFGSWRLLNAQMLEAGTLSPEIDDTVTDANGTVISQPHFSQDRARLLPRDPEALRAHALQVIRDAGATGDPSEQLFRWLVPILTMSETPADLRSAAFTVMSEIDGVVIADGAVEINGRTGVGLAFESDAGVRTELVLDPETGGVIGARDVLQRALPILPSVREGTTISSYSVTTEIVDAVPCASTALGEDPALDAAGCGEAPSR